MYSGQGADAEEVVVLVAARAGEPAVAGLRDDVEGVAVVVADDGGAGEAVGLAPVHGQHRGAALPVEVARPQADAVGVVPDLGLGVRRGFPRR
jgi:hypothetical protein